MLMPSFPYNIDNSLALLVCNFRGTSSGLVMITSELNQAVMSLFLTEICMFMHRLSCRRKVGRSVYSRARTCRIFSASAAEETTLSVCCG